MLDDIPAVSRPDKRLPSRWRTGLGLIDEHADNWERSSGEKSGDQNK